LKLLQLDDLVKAAYAWAHFKDAQVKHTRDAMTQLKAA
jgi:hypothetical protein